tara:strand:- start:337 stop:924 length:588 start_codon:yes stop_codon:yes gene_type:complete
MSRLAFRSPDPSPTPIDATPTTSTHHIIIEATVKPVGLTTYNNEHVAKQASALRELRTTGKDLFELNETRKVESGGMILYQTTEMYGTAVSIEKIIASLQKSDLTLRVNFRRPGVHSSTTCMELSSDKLKRLLKSSVDGQGHKIAELRIKQEQTAVKPSHGALFVAVTCRGTQHYLSHIDYKILASYDAMYHESN